MIYVLLTQLDNIQAYCSSINFAIKQGEIYNISSGEFLKGISNQRFIKEFGGSYFISTDIRGNSVIIDLKTYSRDDGVKIDFVSFPYLSVYDLRNEDINGIYDYSNSRILFETTEWIGRDIIGNYVFGENQQIITCRSVYSAQPLWQYSIESFGTYYDSFKQEHRKYTVSKFLGVWQNELLVAIYEHRIISLDLETGKKLREWNKIEGFHFDNFINDLIPRSDSFVLKGDKLIGVMSRFYIEIDLITGQTHFVDISAEMKKYDIVTIYPVLDNPVTDEHIYLTAMMPQKENGPAWAYECLIALNLHTHQIDWHYAFEEDNLGTNRPQISGNKLYQLDNKKVLHIFERED